MNDDIDITESDSLIENKFKKGNNEIELSSLRKFRIPFPNLTSSDHHNQINILADNDEQISSVWSDIIDSIYDARYIGVIFAFIFMMISFGIAVYPYDTDYSHPNINQEISANSLSSIRPLLTDSDIQHYMTSTMYAESQFDLPPPYYNQIKLKFFTTAGKYGHFRLPELFYYGVMFGISAENGYTKQRDLTTSMLFHDISTLLSPRPTSIIPRLTLNTKMDYSDMGYGLYYSYDDLTAQNLLSNDTEHPWNTVTLAVLDLARKYKQISITQWAPKVYGKLDDDSDPFRYTAIIQTILPTRTGLNGIRSTTVVWLSNINNTEPFHSPKITRKTKV